MDDILQKCMYNCMCVRRIWKNFKCHYTVLNLLCKSFTAMILYSYNPLHFYCLYCTDSRADDCRPLGVLKYVCSDFGFAWVVGKFTSANVICKNQWHKVFPSPLSATERPIQTHQHSRNFVSLVPACFAAVPTIAQAIIWTCLVPLRVFPIQTP